jgi:glycosyltransferase involved in cell wall biosynthesis
MTARSLSVVMPAYNEAEGIEPAVVSAISALDLLRQESLLTEFEILVVDDGSTDSTSAVVEQHFGDDERVRLARHEHNRGVGAGLRTAIDVAVGEVLLSTDADMPVDLGELRRALPLLELPGVGVIAGQRAGFDAEPTVRTLASRAYDRLARTTLGVSTPDVNFPFKLLTLDTARRLHLRSEGALIDAELLARSERLGLRIETIVLDYRSRQYGSSKTMSVRLLRQLAAELVTNRAAIRRIEA